MRVYVDVIIPVHDAEETIEETVQSAMSQSVPSYLLTSNHDVSGGGDDDGGGGDTFTTPCHDKNILDNYKRHPLNGITLDIAVCCQNDGSQDASLDLLHKLSVYNKKIHDGTENERNCNIEIQIFIESNENSKGAGAARNRAASLRLQQCPIARRDDQPYFLCLLDSDDVMHPHRIADQVSVMLALPVEERNATLLGTTFDRIPKDSTWHYTQWANNLKENRLMLERFRELTILQPTWMITKERFDLLGGYIESAELGNDDTGPKMRGTCDNIYRLIHSKYDTDHTLRLAEDLRLFHAHLSYPFGRHGQKSNMEDERGTLKLIRTAEPLLTYRHREGQSQSSSTPRKLLLQLRTKAFTDTIILQNRKWTEDGFIIWGAGRDGKDFFKALPDDVKACVRAFVDVDEKKIASGYYSAPKDIKCDQGLVLGKLEKKNRRKDCYKIPLVHFSLIASDDEKRKQMMKQFLDGPTDDEIAGRITKEKPSNAKEQRGGAGEQHLPLPQKRSVDNSNTDKANKRAKVSSVQRQIHAIPKKDVVNFDMIEQNILSKLPVVVCVALYRTNGVLERNVKNIGREEGSDLWHFS